MAGRLIVVKAVWDEEANVWFVGHSDLPGLNVEAPTVEQMMQKLRDAIMDLLECEDDDVGLEVPIELITHTSMRVRVPDAA